MQTRFKILLLESSDTDSKQVVDILNASEADASKLRFKCDVIHVERLSEATELLKKEDVHVVLLGLPLKGSRGWSSLKAILKQAPQVPVIILSIRDDEDVALQAVQEGAQECLVKKNLTPRLLTHSIRYAIQRKRMEGDLRSSEEKYRSMVSQLPIGIYRTTENGEIIYANQAMADILEYESVEDLLRVNVRDSYDHPEERAKDLESWKEQGDVFNREVRLRTKKDRRIWVRNTGRAALDEQGNVQYIEGFIEDITERKRSELVEGAIYQIVNSTISTDDLTQLFKSIRNHLNQLVDTTNFFIALYDDQTDLFTLPYYIDQKDEREETFSFPRKGSMSGLVIEKSESILWYEKEIVQYYKGLGKETIGSLPKVWLGVPLKLRKRIVGVLCLQSYTNPKAYDSVDLDILEFVSGQIVLAINRKRTEEALLQSEVKYRSMIERLPIGVYRTRVTGEIIHMNPWLADILEYDSIYELLECRADQLYVDPEDRERLLEKWKDNQGVVSDDIRLRTKNGSIKWLRDTGQATLDDKGNILTIDGCLEDVTESKRYQETQSVMYEITNAIITTQDLPSFVKAVQTQLNRVFDATHFFMTLYDEETDSLILPDKRDKNGDLVVLPRKGSLSDFVIAEAKPLLLTKEEMLKRLKAGGEKSSDDAPEVWMGVPLIINSKVIGTLGVLDEEDPSAYTESDLEILKGVSGQIALALEYKRTEEEQARLMKNIESSNQELRDFAYVVSHDLKAPLRGIGSLIGWLMTDYRDKFDDEGKNMLDLIMGRVKRMNGLIEGVLQYSRVGRIKEQMVTVDLNEIVTAAIEIVSPSEHFQVDIVTPLPSITCEKTRILQVFQNLISNAVKYMDKSEGEIKVGYFSENGKYKFYVSDNGPGIEERHFKKIFQMFQTLVPRDELESTGVGLALVKKIVEMYEGQVWVESEVGKGSRFFFTLPKSKKK